MVRAIGIGVVALAATMGGSAWADPVVVAWTTYLYGVPGRQALILDQADAGRRFDRIGCANGWCQVRDGATVGYMEAETLAPVTAAAPWPRPSEACFTAGQIGHDRLVPTRFCPPANLTPANP